MAMLGAVIIFYEIYGLMQRNWANMMIPMATYLFLMYSSAIIDVTSRERAREREMQQ